MLTIEHVCSRAVAACTLCRINTTLLSLAVNWGPLKVFISCIKSTNGVDRWSAELQTWERLRIAHGLLPPALMHQGLSNQPRREGFPSAAPACSSSWHNSSPGPWCDASLSPAFSLYVLAERRVGRGVHDPMRMQSGNQLASISIPLLGNGRTAACGQTHEEDKWCDWSSRLGPLSEQSQITSWLWWFFSSSLKFRTNTYCIMMKAHGRQLSC